MSRSELREHIFKMLFQIGFHDDAEMEDQLELYFDEQEGIKEQDKRYIAEKFRAVSAHLAEIDELLNTHTTGWKTSRMGKTDLTILRLAVYEMKWDNDVPVRVAINEAVELGKKFSGDEGPSFINGVLAKLAQ